MSKTFKWVKDFKAAGQMATLPVSSRHATDVWVLLTFLTCVWFSCSKKATIVPVPKKTSASCSNDYRLVALTSAVVKRLERLVISYIKCTLDPLLFAH